jgi:hypothetical protein
VRQVIGVDDGGETIVVVVCECGREALGRAVRLPIDARFRRFVAVAVVCRSANVARGVGDFRHASELIELRDGQASARIEDGHLSAGVVVNRSRHDIGCARGIAGGGNRNRLIEELLNLLRDAPVVLAGRPTEQEPGVDDVVIGQLVDARKQRRVEVAAERTDIRDRRGVVPLKNEVDPLQRWLRGGELLQIADTDRSSERRPSERVVLAHAVGA